MRVRHTSTQDFGEGVFRDVTDVPHNEIGPVHKLFDTKYWFLANLKIFIQRGK